MYTLIKLSRIHDESQVPSDMESNSLTYIQ